MRLPALLIDADLINALQIPAHVVTASDPVVTLDAGGVTAIQPVGACLLASAVHNARTKGRELVITQWAPQLQQLMHRLGCAITWGDEQQQVARAAEMPHAPTVAMPVTSRQEGNAVANELSKVIAGFIPSEDRTAVLKDEQTTRTYTAVEPVLGHVLSELVDNVFSHAQYGAEAPAAWVAGQWYPTGDLVRLAIVDTGCGLLASLRGWHAPPKNHFEAAKLAFEPFVSSKRDIGMYADRSHLGLGLTVCRDICERLGGTVYAASGNAWIINPGLSTEHSRVLPISHGGTIVSLEFHRRTITNWTMQETLARYTGPRPRFER